jgi:hypothetical protein
MNSANYIKVNVILVVVFVGLFAVSELQADKFAGRKGVPTSGYTQIAPGQYAQDRNYSTSYSIYGSSASYGGNVMTTTIKPWKQSSSQIRTLSAKEKMKIKIEAKKAALKAEAAKRTGRTTGRVKLDKTSDRR